MSDRIEDEREFGSVPDSFQRLWTPHRMVYIDGHAKPQTTESDDCPFCIAPERSDDEGLIVHRAVTSFVLMNLFPYNSGHLLICPYRHVSDYTDLTEDERNEIASLTSIAMRVTREVAHPHGFNLGMNQGDVAGAGIAAHLHQHVVPRWKGDANFLPIIGQTKAVPQLLSDARDRLAAAWPSEG